MALDKNFYWYINVLDGILHRTEYMGAPYF